VDPLPQPLAHDEADRLQAETEQLEGRLLRGEQMIREARDKGDLERLALLERHWLGLLAEYEALCARLQALEKTQPEKTGE